jgi:hypothetical protein
MSHDNWAVRLPDQGGAQGSRNRSAEGLTEGPRDAGRRFIRRLLLAAALVSAVMLVTSLDVGSMFRQPVVEVIGVIGTPSALVVRNHAKENATVTVTFSTAGASCHFPQVNLPGGSGMEYSTARGSNPEGLVTPTPPPPECNGLAGHPAVHSEVVARRGGGAPEVWRDGMRQARMPSPRRGVIPISAITLGTSLLGLLLTRRRNRSG